MRTLLQQVAQPHITDNTPYTYIYALVDPRNNAIRYIGKANNPRQRLRIHLTPHSLAKKTHKNAWIKHLLALGLRPKLETLDWVPVSEWAAEERKWIAHFRNFGPKLTNTTDGGEGSAGLVFSEEAKRKMAEASRGRVHSPEAIEKIREAHKGKRKTVQHCKNMSIGQKKRAENLSEEERKEIRNRPARGKSRYRGVSETSNGSGSWQANCKIDKGFVYIGAFATEKEAARARDIFVIQNFGKDWPLNFPLETYSSSEIAKQPRIAGMFNTNKSGFRGVYWSAENKRWACALSQNNKTVYLGLFPNTDAGKIEAARTYDRWVVQHRVPTAYTNFPRSDYQ